MDMFAWVFLVYAGIIIHKGGVIMGTFTSMLNTHTCIRTHARIPTHVHIQTYTTLYVYINMTIYTYIHIHHLLNHAHASRTKSCIYIMHQRHSRTHTCMHAYKSMQPLNYFITNALVHIFTHLPYLHNLCMHIYLPTYPYTF